MAHTDMYINLFFDIHWTFGGTFVSYVINNTKNKTKHRVIYGEDIYRIIPKFY